MNPNRNGWFQQFVRFRQEHPLRPFLPSWGVKIFEETGLHNESDQAIFYFLQPTGIFYGTPAVFPFPRLKYPQSQYYGIEGNAIVTMLDAVAACGVADRHFLVDGISDETDHLPPVLDILREYYLNYPEEFAPPHSALSRIRRLISKPKNDETLFEESFRHRLIVRPAFFKSRDPFANIFLCMDLYHFLIWQRKRVMDDAPLTELASQYQGQLDQREALIRLIIATVYVDRVLSGEERKMVDQFLAASLLDAKRQQVLQKELDTGLVLAQVDIPDMPWLLRRFFLSLILMMTMWDRTISPEEDEMLSALVVRLGLWPEELEQSRAALSAFLVDQEHLLPGQAARKSFFNFGDHLKEKASIAIRMNLDRLVNEIRETGELYTLLMKSSREKLNPEERQKVHDQLMDILKTIPALAIFALPGGGLILPILIRLLPFNLLPSSFEN